MKNIYLDIDGVLNAVTTMDNPHEHDWDSDWVKKKVNGYWIRYNENMINALNEIAQRDDVEIIWLTTWVDLACTMMSPAIGINGENWRVLDRDDIVKEYFFKWWKLDAIKQDIQETKPERVVWIDDDIKYESEASVWINEQPNFLAISPWVESALTKKNIDEIIEFLDEEY